MKLLLHIPSPPTDLRPPLISDRIPPRARKAPQILILLEPGDSLIPRMMNTLPQPLRLLAIPRFALILFKVECVVMALNGGTCRTHCSI